MSVVLRGSCQCGEVKFRVNSETPYPFLVCYCSICLKLNGAFSANVMGRRATLKVTGAKHLVKYNAVLREPGKRARKRAGSDRFFCGKCGTHLYTLHPAWPEGVWPRAAALDSELPVPPEYVHMMVRYRRKWIPIMGKGPRLREYPKQSIQHWHEQRALLR